GFSLFPLWVQSGPSFLIASVIAGVGFVFLLGAPLNVLVGKAAESGKQASALGLLSLSRQIGLTVFPTVFASFLTKGMLEVPAEMNHKYGDETIELSKEAATSQEQYQEVVSQVESYDLSQQQEMFSSISDILKTGYDQMFSFTSLLAIVIVLAGLYLIKVFKE